MKTIPIVLCFLLSLVLSGCKGQSRESGDEAIGKNKIVGGGCDGCELMYEGMPENLAGSDTSAGWGEPGRKLVVEGTVYDLDGKTPAPDVIIYYWQTDNTGMYSKTAEESTIHGHIRGWVKTNSSGNYEIYTIRPASYPNSSIPAHIHFSIKEPDVRNEYYIDDVLFEEDKFLTQSERKKLPERGGNGVGSVTVRNDVHYIKRNIILGLNIPDYPQR